MYEYKAKILSVYDGDGTFNAMIDLGMNITEKKDIRLYGVDTPELRGIQHDAGIIVRDFVRELILNKEVIINTEKDKTGKYGRLLAEIKLYNNQSLAEILISKGYAKIYFGGKKLEWTEKDLNNIINSV